MKLPQALAGVLIVAAFSTACRDGGPSVSALRHDAGQPVNSIDAWNWTNDTENDYFDIVAAFSGVSTDRNRYLAASEPLRQRLDHWVGAIYDALKAAHPEALQNVPRPEVQVYVTDDINAFVAAIPVCLTNVAVDFGGGGAVVDNVMLYDGEFAAVAVKDGDQPCLKKVATRAEVDDRIARNFTSHNCHVEVKEAAVAGVDQFTLVPGAECALAPAMASLAGAKQLSVLSTSHWVTVFTGIVKDMSEKQLVGVLAHELGHYFRSHVTMSYRYDYAYKLAFDRPGTMPQRPSAAADDSEERELAAISQSITSWQATEARLDAEIQSRKALAPSGVFVPVAGQRFHSGLLPFVIDMTRAKDCGFGLGCGALDPCHIASLQSLAFPEDDAGIERRMMFPQTAAQEAAYLAFEANAASCFEGTTLASTPYFVPSLNSFLAKYEVGRYFPAGAPAAATPIAYLDGLTAVLRQKEPVYAPVNVAGYLAASAQVDAAKAAKKALKTATDSLDALLNSRHVGLFSYEQEADELSGEFLSLVGADPQLSVAVDMEFVKLFGDYEFTKTAECTALHDAGWRNADGTPAIVPIGDLEFHHQDCFRAFNLDRDIAAHGYSAGPFSATFLTEAAWKDFQDSLPADPTADAGGATTLAPPHVAGDGPAFRCAYGDVKFHF